MIFGTAGHIDHGKTSLVKALTGTDADRLAEEKKRGITIDLGFAYWPQEGGESIGFVDVPGHEGYIHNMLAGISSVDAMILVIAVNDGIKPQTREHLQIADYLGMDRGLVALTKCDLADDVFIKERMKEVRTLLANSRFKNCEIIPVSTKTGLGIDRLKFELQSLARRFSKEYSGASFASLSVDRSFSLEGVGTVITGGVKKGKINLEDKLLISPLGKEVRVRGIHAQNKKASSAQSGDRAAINLATIGRDEIKRGDRLISPELHYPTERLDCTVTLVLNDKKTLPVWTPIHFHCGTGHWPARLVPLQQDKLIPGQTQLLQIVFNTPVAVLSGDRFVLRDASASRTIGGGIILDRRAPERNRRKPERLHILAALAKHGPIGSLPALLSLPPFAIDIKNYAADHGQMISEFDEVVKRNNLICLKADQAVLVFDPAIILLLSREMREALKSHHAKHPDQAGLTAERLRLALPHRLHTAAFSAITAHLENRKELVSTGAWIRLPDHVPRLSAEHEAVWAEIKPRLSQEQSFNPPKVGELAEELRLRPETIRGLMKRLARHGDVQEVTADQFFMSQSITSLASLALAVEEEAPEGWFNAATYRDKIGIGRKMAILILEFFDSKGFTIRKGDLRKVDKRKKAMFDLSKH